MNKREIFAEIEKLGVRIKSKWVEDRYIHDMDLYNLSDTKRFSQLLRKLEKKSPYGPDKVIRYLNSRFFKTEETDGANRWLYSCPVQPSNEISIYCWYAAGCYQIQIK